MLWILIAAGVVVIVALAFVLLKNRKPKNYVGADVYRNLMGAPGSAPPAVPADPKLEPLRQNLRIKLLYQEDKIDAALAFERDRNPAGTPEDWHKAAIARWERDNQ